MHHNVNQVAWQIYNLRSAVLLQDQPRHKACRSSYSLCLGDIVITYLISSSAPPLPCLAFPLPVIFAMVREELGAVLLPVPQVVFLSGRQVIGCPLVKGGHAPSHPDADESVAFRRFVSHVVSIAHIFSILWTLHDQAHAVDHVLVPSRDLLLLLLVPPIPQLLVEALRVHVDVRALRGRVEVFHQHVLG